MRSGESGITMDNQRFGFFVAVEGGDGAGKGGVVQALFERLSAVGIEVLVTREPGGTPEGEHLRAVLLAADGPIWQPEAELLLMTAARVQHVKRVIQPALKRGCVVICDRFVGSTIAYQGAGRGLDIRKILRLHREFVDDLWPDITLVLDVSPKVGLGRSRARLEGTGHDEGRFEALENGFHNRVRESFLKQAAEHPARHIKIDGHASPSEVRASAVSQVLETLDKRRAKTQS